MIRFITTLIMIIGLFTVVLLAAIDADSREEKMVCKEWVLSYANDVKWDRLDA